MQKTSQTRSEKASCASSFAFALFWLFLALLLPFNCRAGIESPTVSMADIKWKNFSPASEVYIDTTLQFTPSVDALPDVDISKDKLALWLNVDSAQGVTNLCVYSSFADLAPAPVRMGRGVRIGGARGAVTAMKPRVFKLRGTETLKPGEWHRLTVRTIKDVTRRSAKTGNSAHGLLGFQIYLDGALLASDEPSFSRVYTAFASGTEGWLDMRKEGDLLAFLQSGTVFVSLCGESADDSVGSVGFRGDGAMEGVEVSADAPGVVGVSSLDFTLSLDVDESVVAWLVNGASTIRRKCVE